MQSDEFEISIIVNKLLAVLLLPVLFIRYFVILYFLVACLFLNSAAAAFLTGSCLERIVLPPDTVKALR